MGWGMRLSRRLAVATVVVAVGLAGAHIITSEAAPKPPAGSGAAGPAAAVKASRAFQARSFWNTPLPADAPTSPKAAAILQYMSTAPESDGGCLRLAGASGNRWGQPVFFAKAGDPTYDVQVSSMDKKPPEFSHIRIPRHAQAASNKDATMTLFDKARGYVVAFTGARYAGGQWRARGATITYLKSNGLNVKTGRSDDHRNRGTHRGNNGATMMARYREIQAGQIRHVLKVSTGPEAHTGSVFPMVGSDGDSLDPNAPKQGTRFRIKPSVDLDALHLAPQAKIIAQALQQYGMYIGDSAGHTTLKLEDTRAEGRGQLWKLNGTSMCTVPLTSQYWDVIRDGYDPSR